MVERPDLETDRLRLRRPVETDGNAIADLVGDWEVARRLAVVPFPYGADDARFFLEQIVPKSWVWAITLRPSGELVGMAGLTPSTDGAAALGYWIGRHYWGAGIATEADGAVLSHGFQVIGLPHVTAGYFEDNPASGRVLEKLGFTATGRAMLHCLAVGTSLPSMRMRLERQSFLVSPGP